MELDDGYYASPRWTYEILDCAMPMTFDTYSNCAHQCVYCFAFFQRAVGTTADDYLHHRVRAVDVERVKRMFTDPDKFAGQFAPYIKRRMVMQWGGMSDGFDWYERKFGKSLELLRFFKEIDYPVSISTKGVWFVDDPRYQDVLRDAKNVHFKYSIITSDPEKSKIIEAGVPAPQERFDALRKLNDLGIGATTLRFRPFVIGLSDLCVDEMLDAAKEAGCYSVTTEFLCWESRSTNITKERLAIISKLVGYDVWEFYVANSSHSSGLLRLNYDLKRPYIDYMEKAAEERGLKFFVSDAHHKEASHGAGCCGLPDTGPLSNINRGQYAEAILIAKRDGLVRWSQIAEDAAAILKGIPFYRAEGFPGDTFERAKRRYMSMYDYMRDMWNNPQSYMSPARYFGGALVPSGTDDNGDVIYLYNKPFVEMGIRVRTVSELAKSLGMTGKPRAEKFDEMTADGAEHGYIAFPVVVFSKGRAKSATTPFLLGRQRINYTLVVPKSEWDDYANAYPGADVVGVDDSLNIAEVRAQVQKDYIEQGAEYVWLLDDDIGEVYKKDEKGEYKPTTLRMVMSALEGFNDDYSNIAAMGLLDFGNKPTSPNKPYELNGFVRGFTLVNLRTGVDFPIPEKILKSDIQWQVANLSQGYYCTVRWNDYAVGYSIAANKHGGANRLYLEGYGKSSANDLVSLYAGIVFVLSDKRFTVDTELGIKKTSLMQPLQNRGVQEFLRKEAAYGNTDG